MEVDAVRCKYCWSLNESDECAACLFKFNRPPRQLEWPFRYRAYRKQRVIHLKPAHDKTNHFSIVWTKQRVQFTEDAFNAVDAFVSIFRRTITCFALESFARVKTARMGVLMLRLKK